MKRNKVIMTSGDIVEELGIPKSRISVLVESGVIEEIETPQVSFYHKGKKLEREPYFQARKFYSAESVRNYDKQTNNDKRNRKRIDSAFGVLLILILAIFAMTGCGTVEEVHDCSGTHCSQEAVKDSLANVQLTEAIPTYKLHLISDASFGAGFNEEIFDELKYRMRNVCQFESTQFTQMPMPDVDQVLNEDLLLPSPDFDGNTFYVYLLTPSKIGVAGYVNMPETRFDLVKNDSRYWKCYVGYRDLYDDILTITHEFGHLFSLPHTFDASIGCERNSREKRCECRAMSYDRCAHRFIEGEEEQMLKFNKYRT